MRHKRRRQQRYRKRFRDSLTAHRVFVGQIKQQIEEIMMDTPVYLVPSQELAFRWVSESVAQEVVTIKEWPPSLGEIAK